MDGRRLLGGLLLLASGLSAHASVQAQEKEPASPADRYQALVQSIRSEDAGFRNATTDAERRAAIERLHVVALRYTEFAEAHASDPIDEALEKLILEAEKGAGR